MKLYYKETHEEVELPAALMDFRGEEWLVVGIARNSEPGKSGKVRTSAGRIFYPTVFDCYIADGPKK